MQLQQAGRREEAQSLYRQILVADPQHLDATQMLAVLTHESGRSDEAIEMLRGAIREHPGFASCHGNLGMMLASQGKLDEAIDCFRRALALQPDSPETLNNLGTILLSSGDLEEAIRAFGQAVALRPGFSAALGNLGTALCTAGRAGEGIAALCQALALRPDSAPANFNLGKALHEKGELDEAAAVLERALSLQPDYPEALNGLGLVFQSRRQFADAVAHYRRALSIRPDHHEILNNLGSALQEQQEFDAAIAAYRQAIALRPDYPEALGNLANVLSQVGEFGEALALYQRSLALKLDARTASSMLMFLHMLPEWTPRQIYQEHALWHQTFARPLAASIRRHENDRSENRRLRIGYVSPDWGDHPIGRFMLPLLAHHDHGRFEIVVYTDGAESTELFERLRSRADVWQDTQALSNADLAERIRADRIDILVDLDMHAKARRLPAFARKPAPVQVAYLSYCSTTGMEAIDYRLSDPYLDPPGMDESVYSEKTIRLPHTFWCYAAPDEAPPVNAPPAMENGYVTFGCLNNFAKISPLTIDLWAGILREVGDSRLLVHARPGSHRDRFRQRFADRGVDPGRVDFVDHLPLPRYFQQYHRIDVALDPFPFGGGTTTCETLWMGVPVVTLAGQTAVSRAGTSILSNVGLPELVARLKGQYIQIAADLARDLPRLSGLRNSLRPRMLGSPLMDAADFARQIERAYRQMWSNWVRGR
jgi:predicted O-linked N-acetylglucosamine transferase (SPINDLY family)